MAVEVKFGRVPGRLEDGILNEGTSVREALASLDLTVAADEVVSVNGVAVELDSRLAEGARTITVAKRVKGNLCEGWGG